MLCGDTHVTWWGGGGGGALGLPTSVLYTCYMVGGGPWSAYLSTVHMLHGGGGGGGPWSAYLSTVCDPSLICFTLFLGSQDVDGEEGMSRSDAISGRAMRPLSMEMVCLGKRRRKRWSAVMLSSPMAGSSALHSPTAPRDVSHSPGSGISVATPPDGCGGGVSTPKASPLPAHTEVGSINLTSVCDGTVVGNDERRNTCVKDTDVVRTPTAVSAKTKFKESFNFSFSVSRSPYSRTKDRCRLVRIGSRARHRKSLGVK